MCVGRIIACGEVGIDLAKCTQCVSVEYETHLFQSHIGCDESTTNEEGHLHNIGPCHRSKTTVDRIDTCNDEKQEHDDHTDADGDAKPLDSKTLKTEDLLDGQCTKPSN